MSGTKTARLTMRLQAEAPHAELQGVRAMEVTAWAEPRPRLILLTHADVDVLQRQLHALRGQGQEPVLKLCQHALCRSGCTVDSAGLLFCNVIMPVYGMVCFCEKQSSQAAELFSENPLAHAI